jgi:hypothetical protein
VAGESQKGASRDKARALIPWERLFVPAGVAIVLAGVASAFTFSGDERYGSLLVLISGGLFFISTAIDNETKWSGPVRDSDRHLVRFAGRRADWLLFGYAAMLLTFATGVLAFPEADYRREILNTVAQPLGWIFVAVAVVLVVRWARLRGREDLVELTADGIRVRQSLSDRTLPWDGTAVEGTFREGVAGRPATRVPVLLMKPRSGADFELRLGSNPEVARQLTIWVRAFSASPRARSALASGADPSDLPSNEGPDEMTPDLDPVADPLDT